MLYCKYVFVKNKCMPQCRCIALRPGLNSSMFNILSFSNPVICLDEMFEIRKWQVLMIFIFSSVSSLAPWCRLVRDYRFSIIFLDIDVNKINHRWYVHASTISSSSGISAWLPEMTKKIISVQTEAPQKGLRPWQTSIWRGKSKSTVPIFVSTLFGKFFWKKGSKMEHAKIGTAYLDSLHQDLPNAGLGVVVALLVCSGINFVCVHWGSNPAVQNI